MPGPLKQFPTIDAANAASKLPEPLRKPSGMLLQALLDAAGSNDPLSGMTPGPLTAPVAGAVTLLSKGQMLNNLLNHVEDLKGTPYEKAAEALAEKSPHILGSVGKIRINKPPPFSGLTKLPWDASGGFWTTPIHELSGMARKGFPVGDVSLNAGLLSRVFANPAKVLGHEVTHAAQALSKNPSKFDRLYAAALKKFGYARSPYETGAQEGGIHLSQALKGERHLPGASEDQLKRVLKERLTRK